MISENTTVLVQAFCYFFITLSWSHIISKYWSTFHWALRYETLVASISTTTDSGMELILPRSKIWIYTSWVAVASSTFPYCYIGTNTASSTLQITTRLLLTYETTNNRWFQWDQHLQLKPVFPRIARKRWQTCKCDLLQFFVAAKSAFCSVSV